jgi:hypothetical protein
VEFCFRELFRCLVEGVRPLCHASIIHWNGDKVVRVRIFPASVSLARPIGEDSTCIATRPMQFTLERDVWVVTEEDSGKHGGLATISQRYAVLLCMLALVAEARLASSPENRESRHSIWRFFVWTRVASA